MSAILEATGAPSKPAGDVSEAWRAEFRRRVDDIRSGRVQALDAEAVEAELLAELEATDPR